MPTELLLAETRPEGGRMDWGMILAFIGGGGLVGAFTNLLAEWWGRRSAQQIHDLEANKADLAEFEVFTRRLMERMEQQDKKIDSQSGELELLGKALKEEQQARREEHEKWERRFATLRRSFRTVATLFRQLQDHVRHRNGRLENWFPAGIPEDFPHTPPHLLTPIDDTWDEQVGG